MLSLALRQYSNISKNKIANSYLLNWIWIYANYSFKEFFLIIKNPCSTKNAKISLKRFKIP